MLSFLLGKFLELDGTYFYGTTSNHGTHHSSIVGAKRTCLRNINCYGISHDTLNAYSLEFPVWRELGGKFFILKKETSLGISIHYKHLNF